MQASLLYNKQKGERGDAILIQIIYGKKGSGKSKRLVDLANQEVETANGSVIYLDDDSRVMYSLRHQIRFVDVTQYGIDTEEKLVGFISGMMASNYDISAIFMDGIRHIIENNLQNTQKFFQDLKFLLNKSDINMVMIISGDEDHIPPFIEEYIMPND